MIRLFFLILLIGSSVCGSDSFSLTFENDLFSSTDQDYTNGIKLTRSLSTATPDSVPLLKGPPTHHTISLFQWMYTPKSIQIAENQPNDRPYAGALGLEYIVFSRQGRVLRGVGAQLGVVGPWALAGETQAFIHELAGATDPQGWSNQIDNYPLLNAVYLYRYKVQQSRYTDVITSAFGAAGTTIIQTGAGVAGRLGWNVPDDFGTYSQEPIIHAAVAPYGAYMTVGVSGRGIAYNHTLQSHPDSNIEIEHIVIEAYMGATAIVNSWTIEYRHTFRTKEYTPNNTGHMFGAITISKSF